MAYKTCRHYCEQTENRDKTVAAWPNSFDRISYGISVALASTLPKPYISGAAQANSIFAA
ncbi:hypothetical protein SDD30_15825 [Moorella naiadis]|uniref:hypothetical protein n=1 Tax=Moorella naiadis (nom. illeg.) TaxID=3093670 RepID=UPI003D9C7CFF